MKSETSLKRRRRLILLLAVITVFILVSILLLRNSRTLAIVSGLARQNDNGKSITGMRDTQVEETTESGDAITSQRISRPNILNPDGILQQAPVPDTNINLLLIGPDVDEANYDTLMIASLDIESKSVTLINIPRDIYVPYSADTIGQIREVSTHYGVNSALNKINAAHSLGSMLDWEEGTGPFADSGLDFTADVISEMFQLYIDDYIYVRPSTFREIVDRFGGVEIDVPYRMLYNDPTQDLHIDLQPGLQLLDGAQAEGFCRFRKGYTDSGRSAGISDNERKANQVIFMKSFAAQHFTLTSIGDFISILENADNYVRTSIDNDRLSSYASYARSFAKSAYTMDSIEVETQDFMQGGVSFLRMLTGNDALDSSPADENPSGNDTSSGDGNSSGGSASADGNETSGGDANGSESAVENDDSNPTSPDPTASDESGQPGDLPLSSDPADSGAAGADDDGLNPEDGTPVVPGASSEADQAPDAVIDPDAENPADGQTGSQTDASNAPSPTTGDTLPVDAAPTPTPDPVAPDSGAGGETTQPPFDGTGAVPAIGS